MCDDKETFYLNNNTLSKIAIRIKFNLQYWKIFNPLEKRNSIIEGNIGLDLEDIYQDLKMELEKLKIGTDEAVIDALWKLKFNFQTHWENHCTNAIRALYYLSQNLTLRKIDNFWNGK